MKRCMTRIFGVLLSVLMLSTGPFAGPARADFTLLDVAGAWYFYSQRGVGQRNAACQVVSCVGGTCAVGGLSKVQFSLYNGRDGRGVWPEFISPRRVPPGAVATLQINGTSFRLRNTFKSRQFYLLAETAQDARAVLNQLRRLERSDRNGRFTVVAPDGRRFEFSARGVNESLDRMARRCTPL